MNEPQINVDHFYHRPVCHAVGLLTEKSQISAISTDLASAGVDVAAVEILCGEQGARILDEHGRYHGLRGRTVRALQRLGYDETTLEIYDEALRKGDLLLQVPATPAERRIVALLQDHHVRDLRARHVRAVPHPRCGVTPVAAGAATVLETELTAAGIPHDLSQAPAAAGSKVSVWLISACRIVVVEASNVGGCYTRDGRDWDVLGGHLSFLASGAMGALRL